MAQARGVPQNYLPARSRHWWAPGHRQVWEQEGRAGAGLGRGWDWLLTFGFILFLQVSSSSW